jgi:hypothetical protein
MTDLEALVAERHRAVRQLLRRLVHTSEQATRARERLLVEIHAELERLGQQMESPAPVHAF